MRTAIAPHELLPKGLRLESLSIETGRVSIRGSVGFLVKSGQDGPGYPCRGPVS